MKIYKIRRKSDGLFSLGGSSPMFNGKGKSWSKLHHITTHLGALCSYIDDTIYKECEVVEFEITETETKTTDMKSILGDHRRKIKEKEEEQEKRYKERIKNNELKQLKELKQKYPNNS
jgi:hypothetical protein